MQAWGAASLGLLACWLAACGGASTRTPTTGEPVAREPAPPEQLAPVGPALEFDVQPDDAEIFIDGEAFGVASEIEANGPISVESGLHQIVIVRAGYKTWRAEVSVKDVPEPIQVRLDAKDSE